MLNKIKYRKIQDSRRSKKEQKLKIPSQTFLIIQKIINKENILILHNIRSVENVGAMFRTADAAGINKIYLTGYTPAPLDRFGRKRKDLAKSALGAEEFVPWEQKKNYFLSCKLKREKFFIIGIEQDKKSIDYKKVN